MIDKLEMFIVLARERHFGHAAEACNVSQPTLSSAIKQLEDQFDTPLVVRGARFQGLTAEGEKVLEWAIRIVGDYRAMNAEMKAARKGLTGKVRIAAIPTALGMIQEITAPFHAAHPQVTFSILSRTSAEILDQIANLDADIGITYLENEPVGQVVSVPLYREEYIFVTADPALFAGRDSVSWAEANGGALCLLTPDMQNRRIIDHYMRLSGAEPRMVVETNSMTALIAHVMTGRWSGILPEKMLPMFAAVKGLRTLRLTSPEGSQLVGAVVTRREPRTPLVEALFRHVRNMSQTSPQRPD